jgi:hypothetical protein
MDAPQSRGDVGTMTENYAIDAIDAFLQTWIGEEALQKQKMWLAAGSGSAAAQRDGRI